MVDLITGWEGEVVPHPSESPPEDSDGLAVLGESRLTSEPYAARRGREKAQERIVPGVVGTGEDGDEPRRGELPVPLLVADPVGDVLAGPTALDGERSTTSGDEILGEHCPILRWRGVSAPHNDLWQEVGCSKLFIFCPTAIEFIDLPLSDAVAVAIADLGTCAADEDLVADLLQHSHQLVGAIMGILEGVVVHVDFERELHRLLLCCVLPLLPVAEGGGA